MNGRRDLMTSTAGGEGDPGVGIVERGLPVRRERGDSGRRSETRTSGAGNGWLLTLRQEPAYPLCTQGAGGGLRPPRPPDGGKARRRAGSAPPSMRPSPGRSVDRLRSAGRSPASGSARSTAAVNLLRRSSAPLRPSVTATTDRADSLLRASRKAGPRFSTRRAARRSAVAANRTRAGAVGVWQGSRSGIVGTICPLRSARGAGVQAEAPRSGGRRGSDAASTPASTCG